MEVKHLVCKLCGYPFRSDEGERYETVRGCGGDAGAITYADPPYDWHPRHGYCLACWLVGEPVPRAGQDKIPWN